MSHPYSVNCEHNGVRGQEGKGRRSRKPLILVVRRLPGRPGRGILRAGARTLRCALGRSGIAADKREGDGATPLAAMRILDGYVRDRRFARISGLTLRPVPAGLGWCDAPGDRNYNRPVRLPYRASAETMRRADRLYDAVVVLDWNLRPRARGRGSAIFLHVAREGYAPTEGCVAISPRDMTWLLPRLSRGTVLKVVR